MHAIIYLKAKPVTIKGVRNEPKGKSYGVDRIITIIQREPIASFSYQ